MFSVSSRTESRAFYFRPQFVRRGTQRGICFSAQCNPGGAKKMRKPIVVVGSINLDLVATADHVPLPGETIIGKDFRTFHGGKGANQPVGVEKLGYPLSMLGGVGKVPFGSGLKNPLPPAGVPVIFVRPVKGSSGVPLINI